MPRGTRGSELIRDIFLNLVKLMINPLVFASVVRSIAGTGDAEEGRPGSGRRRSCTSRWSASAALVTWASRS